MVRRPAYHEPRSCAGHGGAAEGRLIAAACLTCVVLTACGSGSAGPPSPAPVGSSSPAAVTPTLSLPQLAQAFAALNATANTALTAASQHLQAAATIDQAKAAVASALAAYLAFDSGLQSLNLPASLQADVTSQFHADSKVEADYQNAETERGPASAGQRPRAARGPACGARPAASPGRASRRPYA